MPNISAKKTQNPVASEASQEQASQELAELTLAKAKLNKQFVKLKAQARLGAGAVRQQFRQLEAEEATLYEATDNAIPVVSTNARNYDNVIVTIKGYDNSSGVGKSRVDICNEVVQALVKGGALNIPASQMPGINIPEAARTALAELWAEDIERLQANLPLRSHSTLPATAASPEHTPVLQVPQSIPDDQKYKPRQGIVEFLEKGWPAPYIKAGLLSRPDFRRLDDKGDMALRNWLRENELPDHLQMPSRSDVAQQMADDPERVRQAWRVVAAHTRRRGQER